MRLRRSAAGLFAVLLAAACSRKPASIDLSPKTVKIYGIGRAQRLSARVLDKKGEPLQSGAPSWSSSDSAVAEVDAGGRVLAKKAGKASVTATFEGVSAQVPVEIVDVSSIEFAMPAFSLIGPAGTTLPLTWTIRDSAQKALTTLVPVWSVADEKVAKVSDKGVVTSVGHGTTNVVARVGDVQGACEVTVSVRPIGRLELRPSTALVHAGESQHFQLTAFAPDGTVIPEASGVFRSSDAAVATVDAAGVASGHKTGAATIRVELAGASAEATLIVN